MAKYQGIKIVSKVEVNDKKTLAIVYTPGVAASCLKIKENPEASFDYTNRENSAAVISFNYEKSLERAIFLKTSLGIDAYPFEISSTRTEKIKLVVDNIEPSFGAVDLSLICDSVKNIDFNVKIPVLKEPVSDLKTFFLCVSKNLFMFSCDKLTGDTNEKSLQLRKMAGGVVETQLTEEEHIKPVAIVSDGSAVLGLGDIGGEAGLPVMEGKAVLFQELGDVSAMPLCLKTQNADEIIETVLLLQNSFSGVNLEDIKAPRCFEVENTLIEKADIPIFHDDQHGTAVVVLAALLNALHLAEKKIEDVKIIFSGAGAAAIAVCKLILSVGAKNIIMYDIDGAIYKGRSRNNFAHEEISNYTNLKCSKAPLKDEIKGADVFIGLSAPNILNEDMIKSMADKPIVFALANPTPEIMPDKAVEYGAFISASGRSDFPNQINNSLVFPGLFNGVIKNNIKKITNEIKLNCAFALASMVKEDELSRDYILPDALDRQVPVTISNNCT
ncbi:MAG: NADP-dependent malic enzyme [Candidatus Avigastranaerophilus sp.]